MFFVVMENILLDYDMDEIYDLKGSTIGRKSDGSSPILKDLDWNRRMLLNSDRMNALLFQIEMDCKVCDSKVSINSRWLILRSFWKRTTLWTTVSC